MYKIVASAIIVAILGCIVGLQVQIHTGTTPDTSIVGAIFAILIAQIPLRWLKPFKNIHRQNLVQTTISGATFASANCMFLTMGIPVTPTKSIGIPIIAPIHPAAEPTSSKSARFPLSAIA